MKVRKAVIPAAGLGTRVLPASKAIPKEMLTIVDKPSIQYLVEEAVASGIEDILIITTRGKTAMEDHFDRAPELEAALEKSGKTDQLKEIIDIAHMVNIQYLRQKETKGLGHAVLQAKSFIGDEPFAVIYGDDIIMGEDPALLQVIRGYERSGLGSVGIDEVPAELISRYSSMKLEPLEGNNFKITDMIEKPAQGKQFSNYSILGRCVLPPEIFRILENTPPGALGEIQLTDAMKVLAQSTGMVGVDFTGTYYDMGNKLGYMKANVETALSHPEIGSSFKQYLRELVKNF